MIQSPTPDVDPFHPNARLRLRLLGRIEGAVTRESPSGHPSRSRSERTPSGNKRVSLLFGMGVVLALGALVSASVTGAAEAPVGLGTADSYGVLAGAGVTNTGPTTVNGDLGTCPNDTVTGAPAVSGTIHANDAEACQAKNDLTTAYNDAAGRAPTTTYAGATDLGAGPTLTAGVYKTPTTYAITGALTLDAQGDPNSVWIFQVGSALTTADGSSVVLVNGAQACNVFWQVGSSATLAVGSVFKGTIMALAAITAKTGAIVEGRLLASVESVTLDTNQVTVPVCAAPTTTTTSSEGATSATTAEGATTTVAGGPTTTLGETGATTTISEPGVPTTVAGAAATTVAPSVTITPPLVTIPPPLVIIASPPTNVIPIATTPPQGTTATTLARNNTNTANRTATTLRASTTGSGGAVVTGGTTGGLATTGMQAGIKAMATGVAMALLGTMLVLMAGRTVQLTLARTRSDS